MTREGKWWETIDTLKYCYYCGDNVAHGPGYSTVGMCFKCEKIWSADIAGGFKENRLKQIMIDRCEIIQNIAENANKIAENANNHTQNAN